MGRLGWAVVGAGIAIVVVYRLGRVQSQAHAVAETFTPQGLASAVTRGVEELRAIGAELASAMREQEARLTDQLVAPPEDVAAARTQLASRRSPTLPAAWDDDDPYGT